MQCPICGLVSQTPDVCSWCKKPLPSPQAQTQSQSQSQSAPQPTLQPTMAMPPQPTIAMPPPPTLPMGVQPTVAMPPMPPQGGTTQRVSLTGEVLDIPVAPPPVSIPGAPPMPTQRMAAPGGTAPGPYVPPGTIPAAAYSTAYIGQQIKQAEAPPGEQWEKYLAIGFPILALSMFLVHLMPSL